ncbi:MAG: tRNA (adenosine(37)-N6)-threonylcarbamoyltransferase complex dimerization subunit type 1 TsaB [Candidatus Firestonebacteria bacterium RIFOXYA2_FULL_40_8]|nr:MAG: tRNA (adenosine(37)-N6)-threonylcarbamoyltransferase complex dimerization subunit type 1 TsaB [Candidatus Firestonebacteria bacterium RIFOXYA2_FULL_40_8]
MIVLAIETATGAESVALVTENKVLAEVNADIKFGHSSTLLLNIEKIFKTTALEISAVDAIAVSAGPGSFTGLRVGFSLAKGLAYAAKKAFLAIPTLDALAYSFSKTGEGITPLDGKKKKVTTLICPLLDARKEEYYFSLYSKTEKGLVSLLASNSLPLPALIKEVKKQKAEKIVFFGNGADKCKEELKKSFKNADFPEVPPRASAVGALAIFKLLNNEKQDFNKTLPMYIRKPDAVLKKQEKQKQQGKQGKKEK